jgi:molybdopterin-guanine dinucleotide biosynthesis protein B
MKIFGIAGYSGSGKTTLIERVLPVLAGRGLRTSVIKHTHHNFEIDRTGKDSWRFREAGAGEVLLASDQRYAVLHENRGQTPPGLDALLSRFADCDLVLVEGYKREAIPKLEVHRAGTNKPWLFPDDPLIIAVASDLDPPGNISRIDINNIEQLAEFILKHAISRTTAC